jgi:hypothetical protein
VRRFLSKILLSILFIVKMNLHINPLDAIVKSFHAEEPKAEIPKPLSQGSSDAQVLPYSHINAAKARLQRNQDQAATLSEQQSIETFTLRLNARLKDYDIAEQAAKTLSAGNPLIQDILTEQFLYSQSI